MQKKYFIVPSTSRNAVEAALVMIGYGARHRNQEVPSITFSQPTYVYSENDGFVMTGRILRGVCAEVEYKVRNQTVELVLEELESHAGRMNDSTGFELSGLYSVETLLAFTAREVRLKGYTSAKSASESGVSTKGSVLALVEELPTNQIARTMLRESLLDEDYFNGSEALNWCKYINPTNEWEEKIKALAQSGECTRSDVGLVVSIFWGYQRQVKDDRLRKVQAGRKSVHVGVVGEMENLYNVILIENEVKYDDLWGESNFLRFVTAEGDILISYYGGKDKFVEGEMLNIRCKIKEHTGVGMDDVTKISHIKRIDDRGKIVRGETAKAEPGFTPGEITADTWEYKEGVPF